MSNLRLIIASAAFALTATSTMALADRPGSDWISIGEVESIMKENGYSVISEIEADDDRWEGEGIKNDEAYEFHVDPISGEITKDEQDD